MPDSVVENTAVTRVTETPVNSRGFGATCLQCGVLARVHILRGYASDGPIVRRLCIPCANKESDSRASATSDARRRVGLGSLLVFVGVLFALFGAVSAFVDLSGTAGFGWLQTLGVGLGTFVAVCGGLLGIDLLAIAGALLVGMMAGLDLLGSMGHQRNWLQHAGACCGLASILIGLGILRRRNEKRRRAKVPPCKP